MTYLEELREEKQRIENANNMLTSVVRVWGDFVGLNDDDKDLTDGYIVDMLADTVGTRLRNITAEIAELEAEEESKYPNPAKLDRSDVL